MPVVDSLPPRPLSRNEVDSLSNSESVSGVFPVYGDRPENQDTAFGLAIAVGETLYGVGFIDSEWEIVDRDAVKEMPQTPDDDQTGISYGDMDVLQDMQSTIVKEI